MQSWLVLSDEQMSKGLPFFLLNDEQMSNWLGVEHQPESLSFLGSVNFQTFRYLRLNGKKIQSLDIKKSRARHDLSPPASSK